MAELLPSRRRAEHFSHALEGHLQPTDQRLQRLLDTAARLSAVPLVEPRDEFRIALRERLIEAAAFELPAQAAMAASPTEHDRTHRAHATATVIDTPNAARRRRQLVAVATGLVLVGGGTGVAAASEQALPGDMLYPVKRSLETAQVSLASTPGDEGHALLERAATRLHEAESIGFAGDLSEERLDAVESALGDFARDAAAGGPKLLGAYSTSNDGQDVRTVRGFASQSHARLSDLARIVPPESQPALTAAVETVVGLDDLARRACPDCAAGLPPVGLPNADYGAGSDRPPLALADGAPTTRPDGLGDLRDRVDRLTERNSASPRLPVARPAPRDAPSPLPDLDVGSDGRPSRGNPPTGPGDGGDGARQEQRPGLDLGGMLNSARQPARIPRLSRTTGAPRHDDDPNDPLDPPLDGTGGVL